MRARVITVRADTPTGWKHLCKEFGALHGRPICAPHTPTLAIYGKISAEQLGWPVYVSLDMPEAATAIARHKAEKLAEARAALEGQRPRARPSGTVLI